MFAVFLRLALKLIAESLERMLEIAEIRAILNHFDAEVGEFLGRRRADTRDLRSTGVRPDRG